MRNPESALERACSFGVRAIHLGGCVTGSPIHPGQPAAMRRRAHAHSYTGDPYLGTVCFKAHTLERVPDTLFWHEVAHIYRHSWTETQCDTWARRKVRAKP